MYAGVRLPNDLFPHRKNSLGATLPAEKIFLGITGDSWSLAILFTGGHNYSLVFDKADVYGCLLDCQEKSNHGLYQCSQDSFSCQIEVQNRSAFILNWVYVAQVRLKENEVRMFSYVNNSELMTHAFRLKRSQRKDRETELQ